MNQVVLVGQVKESKMEKNYELLIEVTRESGIADKIPVMVPQKLINGDIVKGACVGIKGKYRSYNRHDEDGTHLVLYVQAEKFEAITARNHINDVFIEGFLTGTPVIRYTPKGRKIADATIAVNQENKTDYIPCVFWESHIDMISRLKAGSCIRAAGRIQSREYTKNESERTAYELSVDLMELI